MWNEKGDKMKNIGYHKLGKGDTELINTICDSISPYLNENQVCLAQKVFLNMKQTIQNKNVEYMIPIEVFKDPLAQLEREKKLGVSFKEKPMIYTYACFLQDIDQAIPISQSANQDELNIYLSNFRR